MNLQLPLDPDLAPDDSVLIVGMGGGFDVFCGLPIYFELRERGCSVQLASLSFAYLPEYKDGEWLSDTMVGVGPAPEDFCGYHPERFLSRWFRDQANQDVTVWCIEPTGVQPILQDLKLLAARYSVDTLILVDGGCDSLTRGDEELIGTVMEDYATLVAASLLEMVPQRLMAIIGMGIEGDVSHACVLENIAQITAAKGLLGVSAVLPQTSPAVQYESALSYVHAQPGQQPSVVNASILSAIHGQFGNFHMTERTHGSELWISTLMNLYWFFMLDVVAGNNVFADRLKNTQTAADVAEVIYDSRESMQLRPARPIPLA